MNNIKKIQQIYNSFGTTEPFDWLNGRNFSDAFVISLGAGPWRLIRRQKIQQEAITKLNNRDISDIEIDEDLDYIPEHTMINWFPLDWQNKYLYNMIKYLQYNNTTMEDFCNKLTWLEVNGRKQLYSACQKPEGIKVLSLFCRDSLKINAFPIDRHIKRYLKEQNLPQTEDKMIDLCLAANLKPNLVATGIIKNIAKLENPNWSL